MVDFSPCYSDRELFLKMAEDYVGELKKCDDSIVWDREAWEDSVWDSWFIEEDGKVSGFVMTQEAKFKGRDKLLYIAEFCVLPESRRKGIGFEAVKKLSEMWRGDIFLYILENNVRAKRFWTMVEDRLGWKRIERWEIRQERGCELRVFQMGETT